MAHFTRVRPSGFWTLNSVVDPAEFEQFDAQLYAAINGDAGGTWAPSIPITIGGAGINVTGLLAADDVEIGGTLEVGGQALFNAPVTIDNDLAVNGAAVFYDGVTFNDTVSFDGPAQVETGNTFTVGNGATLSIPSGGTQTIASGATFTIASGATVTIGAATTFNGAMSLTKRIGLSSNAAISIRRVAGADAATAYGVVSASGTVVADEVDIGTLTAARTYTVDDGIAGDRIRFTKLGTDAFTVTIRNQADSATIATLGPKPGSYTWVDLTFNGTAWIVAAGQKNSVGKKVVAGVDADHTYKATDADIIIGACAGRVYSFSQTDAYEGAVVTIHRTTSGSATELRNSAGALLGNLAVVTFGTPTTAKVLYTDLGPGGEWILLELAGI
jgi:hypothetical protein